MLWLTSELSLYLVITCIVAGGVLGSLIRAWSILSRLYSLESRADLFETKLTSEIKARASAIRWNKATMEEEALAAKLANPLPEKPVKKFKWWENPALKRGAYVP